jgi:hypothetical protein
MVSIAWWIRGSRTRQRRDDEPPQAGSSRRQAFGGKILNQARPPHVQVPVAMQAVDEGRMYQPASCAWLLVAGVRSMPARLRVSGRRLGFAYVRAVLGPGGCRR